LTLTNERRGPGRPATPDKTMPSIPFVIYPAQAAWLARQPNKSAAVRAALDAYMAKYPNGPGVAEVERQGKLIKVTYTIRQDQDDWLLSLPVGVGARVLRDALDMAMNRKPRYA
jgi:hypothetical protein